MKKSADLRRYQNNWQGEVQSAALYQTLSKVEKNPKLAQVYANLAAVELRHAKFWEEKIRGAGGTLAGKEGGQRYSSPRK